MLLFALALDPVCQWLLVVGPPRFGFSGYADDFWFCLANLSSNFLPVFERISLLADAVGSELHYAPSYFNDRMPSPFPSPLGGGRNRICFQRLPTSCFYLLLPTDEYGFGGTF
eukprot:1767685-Pyramimonas_sp.AAC.1